jgi:hypothetical protein
LKPRQLPTPARLPQLRGGGGAGPLHAGCGCCRQLRTRAPNTPQQQQQQQQQQQRCAPHLALKLTTSPRPCCPQEEMYSLVTVAENARDTKKGTTKVDEE